MCPQTAFDVRSRGICHPWIYNRSVQNYYLPALTADQPMNRFQNKGSIYPYTSYTDSNRSHEFVRIKNVAQKLLNPGVIQTLTQ